MLEDNHIYGYIAGMVTGEDSLIMVTQLNTEFDYEAQLKVAVHEIVHLVINHINWRVPAWLNEGIAYYECSQWEYIKEGFAEKINNDNIPTFLDLGEDYQAFFNIEGAQAFAYTLTQYIVETYGYDELNAFIRTPSDFEEIFLISKDAFWEDWYAYLKRSY